jgi:hypothetical protein
MKEQMTFRTLPSKEYHFGKVQLQRTNFFETKEQLQRSGQDI